MTFKIKQFIMGILEDLFNKDRKDLKQAVFVNFSYGIESLDPLHNLEKKLTKIIDESETGEYDGHEIAVDSSDGCLYMYGPNAELLFKKVRPILQQTSFMKEAVVTLRFGSSGDDVPEIDVSLNS